MSMNPEEKKVDESWKERVEKERQTPHSPEPPKAQPQGREPPPAATKQQPGRAEPSGFSMFLSSLSMQAMMALGEAAHPVTGAAQMDLEQARYLIDVLGILQEKTQGNLTPEEVELVEGLLYELRTKYVEKTQGK